MDISKINLRVGGAQKELDGGVLSGGREKGGEENNLIILVRNAYKKSFKKFSQEKTT